MEGERVQVGAVRRPAALGVAEGPGGERARHAGVIGEALGVARLLLAPQVGHGHREALADRGDGGPRLGRARGVPGVVRHDVLEAPPVREGVGDVAREGFPQLGHALAGGHPQRRDAGRRRGRRDPVSHPPQDLGRGDQEPRSGQGHQVGADVREGAAPLGHDARRVLVDGGEPLAPEQHARAAGIGNQPVRALERVDELHAGTGGEPDRVGPRVDELLGGLEAFPSAQLDADVYRAMARVHTARARAAKATEPTTEKHRGAEVERPQEGLRPGRWSSGRGG